MIMNQLKTIMLLTALGGLLMLLGSFLGGAQGLTFAFIMALLINGIMYFFSDRIVLSMYRAKRLQAEDDPQLFGLIQELTETMQLPMPKVWLIHSDMANAFATGRNPRNASIAFTTGILSLLDAHELRGVVAHELSHVKNRDILVATIAATMAATIGYVCNMLQRIGLYESISGSKNRRTGNPIVMFIIALLMPLAATLLQLAISRSREYLADETGAHSCHDPLSLASALQKLHNHIPYAHLNNKDSARANTAPLFIVNPFNGSSVLNLLSTHPPIEQRIARLHEMHRKLF